MKVYAVESTGSYEGGMAVVAANSEAEAKALAYAIEALPGVPSSVDPLPCTCDGDPRVLIYYSYSE